LTTDNAFLWDGIVTDYSDNFNRANGAPGSNWTAVNSGTWAIASNALTQSNVIGVYRGLRWTPAFAGNNLYARVTARAPAGMGFGVLVRCPSSGTALTDIDGYAIVGFVGDQWYRIEFADGSDAGYVGLGGTCAANTNYTIEVRADGSTITVLLNNSQLAQWTDSTYTTGGAMLVTYGGTVTFDDFAAGDIASGVSVSVNDTGGGADALAQLGVTLGLFDGGAGSEVFGGEASVPTADAGAGADMLAQVLAALALAESGAAVDAPGNVTASVPVSDAGVGSDSQAITATLTVADTGGGIDAVLGLILVALADSSVGADSLRSITANINIADTGAAGEAQAVAVAVTVADAGSAEAAINVLSEAMKSIADSGAGVDAIASPLVALRVLDGAGATDGQAVSVVLALADSGAAVDALHLLTEALKRIADSGAGTDAVLVPAVQIGVTELATGGESLSMTITLAVDDVASGIETPAVLASLAVTDSGAGQTAIAVLSSTLIALFEMATGAESIGVTFDPLLVTDAGTGSEATAAQVALALSDGAVGVDGLLASVLVAVSEAAAAVDGVGDIVVSVPVTDSGQAAVVLGAVSAVLSVTEMGAGVDVAVGFDAAVRIVTIVFAVRRRSVAFAWLTRSVSFGLTQRGIGFLALTPAVSFGLTQREIEFGWNQ